MADQTLGRLFVDLLLRDSQFQAQMKAAEGTLGDSGAVFTDLASTISDTFTLALEAATVAVTGLLAASAAVGASFEQEITKVAVLAGGGLDELSEAARQMGASTKFSATEAAEAMESLAQAGFDTTAIIGGTEAALALAASSGGTLADATKIVAATMSQFQLTAADSARISDVFTSALNSSQLDMEGLALAMSYAGTVGASFGMTLEETTAAVAQFSNLGLEGSKAGTAFRMAMSQAANVTDEGRKILEKYGLVAEDISPELHDFGEILRTVGAAGISTTDALKIFGTEAGGNVAALAQQAVDARTEVSATFEGIVSDLEGSAGVAATTAADMTQTVAGAFEEASGAFEEVLLSLYDTYAGPLRDLLLQVGEFIDAVGVAFRRNSTTMSDGFGGALEDLTAWLDENENRLVTMALEFMDGVAKVSKLLVALIPYLDEIVVLMGSIWLVSQVLSFASALSSAWGGVVALQGALAALGIELTAMTGGLYLVVAAIGIIVASIVAYVAITNDATMAAERLTAAQTKQAALTDEAFRAEVEHAAALLATQQASAQAEIASGSLTDVRRRELETILGLDAETAALLVRQGKLIESNGELRTAASLVAQAFDEADASGIGGAMDEIRAKELDLTRQTIELAAAMGKSKEEIAKMTGVDVATLDEMGVRVSALGDQFAKGNVSARNFGAAIAASTGQVDVTTLEEAQVRLDALTGALKDTRKAQTQVRNDAALAQRAMVDEEERKSAAASRTTGAILTQGDAAEDAAGKVSTLATEQARMADANADLLAKLAQQLEDALATEADRRALAQGREVAEIAAKFEDEIALYQGNADRVVQISAQRDEAIRLARERFAAEDVAAEAARIGSIADALAEAERAVADELAAIRTESMSRAERLEQDRAAKVAAIDADLAARLEGIEGVSAERRAEIIATFYAETADERLAIEEDYARRIAAARRDDIRDAIAAPSKVVTAWRGAIADLVDDIPEGFQIAFGRSLRAVQGFASGAVAALSSVAGVASSVFGSVAGLVETISGFSFSIADMMSAVSDARGSEDEPVAGFSAAQAAIDFVQGLIEKSSEITKMLVDAIGPALTALAAGIGDLLRQIAEALPDLALSIADVLPDIVDAIAEALPALIRGLVEAVVILVVAIIEQIPTIVIALLEAIPVLIGAVVEALPQIVTALIAALPQIVTAVVAAIPDLLIAIIAALPTIITELVRLVIVGLPRIVIAFVTAIFTELIPRLPEIGLEIVKAIIEGIKGLADVIGDAIKGIFGGGGGGGFLGLGGDRSDGGAYSGIEYVPATMRATLHPGEAVIPADRNSARLRGEAYPAPAGAGQVHGMNGGGGGPVEIAIVAEGQLLEAVMVRGQGLGKATAVQRSIRRAAGVRVGFSRGQFTPWGG